MTRTSLQHLLTHTPAHADCRTCRLAKARSSPHTSVDPETRARTRGLSSYAESVTMDHKNVVELGFSGEAKGYILVIQDLWTSFLGTYCSNTKSSEHVLASLQHFVGARAADVKRIHCDNADELTYAAAQVGSGSTQRTTIVPGDHVNNSIIEGRIGRLANSIKCSLHRSGLHHSLWPHAATHSAAADNITLKNEQNETPFSLKHPGVDLPCVFPFGSRCDVVLPVEARREMLASFEPSAMPAIYLGPADEFGLFTNYILIQDMPGGTKDPNELGLLLFGLKSIIFQDLQ